MSASSSNKKKKIKEMPIDRLSELPDGILCYVLSFLEMKEAAITCLLSKRWQFLWTQLPSLRFEGGCKLFVSRVNRTLVICRRDNLERFEVTFSYGCDECSALDVNVWIRFAVANKVKIFSLLLPRWCRHVLPQMMYSNPSWTSLTLQGCSVIPRGAIQWQSLTTLWLKGVSLDERTFEKIFSGCPLLSSLDIWYCRGFNSLEVNSRSLHTLVVKHSVNGDLKISAPHIHTFKIDLLAIDEKFILENIKSLVIAEIDFYEEWDSGDMILARNSMEQLFGGIGDVTMLKLGPTCSEILSAIPPDWQFPQSTRQCLELHAFHNFMSIPAILHLLKSSPNLESLVINIDGTYDDEDEITWNPGSKNDLDCDLLHLKIVCFKHLGYPEYHTDEPMSTLARILLKRASVLEKMVVSFPRFTASASTAAFYKTTQTLLSYPRSSQKAAVLFNL